MKSLRLWIVLTVLVLAAVVPPLAAAAQTPGPSDDEVNAVARQLYCPVCENVPLDMCSTQACAQWRALIREKLAQGWSEEQIKTYFVEQYGDQVTGVPPARGLNWLIYILPPVVIAAGGYGLFLVLRRMRKASGLSVPAASSIPASAAAEDEYIRRVEEELKRRS